MAFWEGGDAILPPLAAITASVVFRFRRRGMCKASAELVLNGLWRVEVGLWMLLLLLLLLLLLSSLSLPSSSVTRLVFMRPIPNPCFRKSPLDLLRREDCELALPSIM